MGRLVLGIFGVNLFLLLGMFQVTPDNSAPLLAFLSNRDGSTNLYLTDMEGSMLVQLTFYDDDPLETTLCHLGWVSKEQELEYADGAPSGSFSCYNALRPVHPIRIWRKNLLGNEYLLYPSGLVGGTWSSDRQWTVYDNTIQKQGWGTSYEFGEDERLNNLASFISPNGAYIATRSWNDDSELKLYIVATENRELIAHYVVANVNNIDTWLTWSPDNQWVAYASIEGFDTILYRIRFADGFIERLGKVTPNFTYGINYLGWSPDGQWLLYFTQYDIYVLNVETGAHQRLALYSTIGGFDALVHHTWSPDGQWIIFTGDDNQGNIKLFKIHPDGTGRQQITFGAGYDGNPVWIDNWTPPKSDLQQLNLLAVLSLLLGVCIHISMLLAN